MMGIAKLFPLIFHLQSRCLTIAANQWMGSAWYLCQRRIGSGGNQPGQGCAVGSCNCEQTPPWLARKRWRLGGPAEFGDLQSLPEIYLQAYVYDTLSLSLSLSFSLSLSLSLLPLHRHQAFYMRLYDMFMIVYVCLIDDHWRSYPTSSNWRSNVSALRRSTSSQMA